MRSYFLLIALLSAALAVQAQDSLQSRTEEKQAALGALVAHRVQQQTTPLGLTRVDEYVQHLTDKLSPHLPAPGNHWTVRVIREDTARLASEPIALPGGYIFVPARLLLSAKDEAEFAGLLAHAMAHVSEGHGFQKTAARETDQSQPFIFLDSTTPGAAPISILRARGLQELEADRVAVRVMASAGYDPNALLRSIRRMQPPAESVRIHNLEEDIEGLPPVVTSIDTVSFTSLQAQVRDELAHVQVARIPSLLHPQR